MGGLGPMLGQLNHFHKFAPERIPYALDRYRNETKRLYGVLNGVLEQSTYISGPDYTIADMACYPWIAIYEFQDMKIDDYPAVKKWYLGIKDRKATIKAYELAKKVKK
jgi:GST-like protein